MRPRCCLRYLTFFGINMMHSSSGRQRLEGREGLEGITLLACPALPAHPAYPALPARLRSPGRPSRTAVPVFFVAAHAWHESLSFVEPDLHANLAVGGARLREPVVDIRAQRLQGQLAVQIPL